VVEARGVFLYDLDKALEADDGGDGVLDEGIREMIGAGVMNWILLDMAVVGAMAGAAMCDGLTAKSCFGMDRLTTPPGKGTEKLTGVPASLPITNLNMVTYLPCKKYNVIAQCERVSG